MASLKYLSSLRANVSQVPIDEGQFIHTSDTNETFYDIAYDIRFKTSKLIILTTDASRYSLSNNSRASDANIYYVTQTNKFYTWSQATEWVNVVATTEIRKYLGDFKTITPTTLVKGEERFAPLTVASQVYTEDGETVEAKIRQISNVSSAFDSIVVTKRGRTFTIPVPFEDYFNHPNAMLVYIGTVQIYPNRYSVEGNEITFQEDVDVNRTINFHFIYNSKVPKLETMSAIDGAYIAKGTIPIDRMQKYSHNYVNNDTTAVASSAAVKGLFDTMSSLLDRGAIVTRCTTKDDNQAMNTSLPEEYRLLDGNIIMVRFHTDVAAHATLRIAGRRIPIFIGPDPIANNQIIANDELYLQYNSIDDRLYITNGLPYLIDHTTYSYEVKADGEALIRFDTLNFNPGTDRMEVFQNGVRLNEIENYTFSSDSKSIALKGYSADKGDIFEITVYKVSRTRSSNNGKVIIERPSVDEEAVNNIIKPKIDDINNRINNIDISGKLKPIQDNLNTVSGKQTTLENELKALKQQTAGVSSAVTNAINEKYNQLRDRVAEIDKFTFSASKVYKIGDRVIDRDNNMFECTKGGVTATENIPAITNTTKFGKLFNVGNTQWEYIDRNDGTPVGHFVLSAHIPDGYVLLNGQTLNKADIPRVVHMVDKYNLWAKKDSDIYRFKRVAGDDTKITLPKYVEIMRFENFTDLLNDRNRVLTNVAKIKENETKIAQYQAQLRDAQNAYNTANAAYQTKANDINNRLNLIGKIDLTRVNSNLTNLDTVAQELKQRTEEGFNISYDLEFYKDYIKKYLTYYYKSFELENKIDASVDIFNSEMNYSVGRVCTNFYYNLNNDNIAINDDKNIFKPINKIFKNIIGTFSFSLNYIRYSFLVIYLQKTLIIELFDSDNNYTLTMDYIKDKIIKKIYDSTTLTSEHVNALTSAKTLFNRCKTEASNILYNNLDTQTKAIITSSEFNKLKAFAIDNLNLSISIIDLNIAAIKYYKLNQSSISEVNNISINTVDLYNKNKAQYIDIMGSYFIPKLQVLKDQLNNSNPANLISQLRSALESSVSTELSNVNRLKSNVDSITSNISRLQNENNQIRPSSNDLAQAERTLQKIEEANRLFNGLNTPGADINTVDGLVYFTNIYNEKIYLLPIMRI